MNDIELNKPIRINGHLYVYPSKNTRFEFPNKRKAYEYIIKNSNGKFDYTTIKTFEAACIKTNVDITGIPDVSEIQDRFKKHIIAAYKLMIIFEAINNGWKPNWLDKKQIKFYPTFLISMESSTMFYLRVYIKDTRMYIGESEPRLCTDSSEKALYIGHQFMNEYKDYLI